MSVFTISGLIVELLSLANDVYKLFFIRFAALYFYVSRTFKNVACIDVNRKLTTQLLRQTGLLQLLHHHLPIFM